MTEGLRAPEIGYPNKREQESEKVYATARETALEMILLMTNSDETALHDILEEIVGSAVKDIKGATQEAFLKRLQSDVGIVRAFELRREVIDPDRKKRIVEKYFPINPEAQYQSQAELFKSIGLLQELSDGSLGVKDTDCGEHPFPSYDALFALLEKKKDMLKQKIDQGFSRIVIVPPNVSNEQALEACEDMLLEYSENGVLFKTKKDPVEPNEYVSLSRKKPIKVTTGTKVNDFHSLSLKKGEKEIVYREKKESTYKIVFIEDMQNIPRKGEGKKIGGRKQIETGIELDNEEDSAYIKMLKKKEYALERPMSIKEWFLFALTYAQEHYGLIDERSSTSFVDMRTRDTLGMNLYFTIPFAMYHPGDKDIIIGHNLPGSKSEYSGIRNVVDIGTI